MTYTVTAVDELPPAVNGRYKDGLRLSDYEQAVQEFRESSAIHALVEFEGVGAKTIYQGLSRAIGDATDVVRVMRGGKVYLTKVVR